MRNTTARRIVSLALAISVPLCAVPTAAADSIPNATKATDASVSESEIAAYLEELDNAQTDSEAQAALSNFLGEDNAARAIEENSASQPTHVPRGAGTFLTCVKGKASSDVRSVFDLNVVAAAIGQKNYAKAAAEAAKYLAKQGVKRNAASLVGMFAYWGWKCRGEW